MKNKLLEKKTTYQGMAYRKVANEIEDISFEYKKIIFVGFNALTQAEEKILKYLVNVQKAEILWDADKYYFDNPNQEAGKFIRSNYKTFNTGTFRWKTDHFATENKKIQVTGVSQNIGQVKLTGQILQNLASKNQDDHNTAIVLADENLLLPLLNSLPENIKEYNVTMGLPLKNTPVYGLFEAIILLHENSEKNKGNFYFKDLLRVFDSSYISKLLQDPAQQVMQVNHINQFIRNSNRVYYNLKNLENSFKNNDFEIEAIRFLFYPKDYKSNDIITILISLVKALKETYQGETEEEASKAKLIELEYLFHFAKVFNRLQQISTEYEFVNNIRTLRKLFSLITSSITIPFYGEPLKGIQVMGMLETRTLDFKNIIVLSVNEGIIPSGKIQNSFIPFDIKSKFHLPTYREKDAIFAYHFYRLLQCAEEIHLLYNTQSDSIGGGDKSRFITQILHEIPVYNKAISIEEKILSVPPIIERSHFNIIIEKSKEIIIKLSEKAEQGFSPSSILRYKNCQLQFYFYDIMGLRETDEVEETVETSTLGSIIHKVLYELFLPYLNISVNIEHYNQMEEKAEETILRVFQQEYKDGDITTGKNFLLITVVNEIVKNFLELEKKFL
ncbi:PD-(D/E)XK nuclease family protein, partial [candidate division KSB1 bacterium]